MHNIPVDVIYLDYAKAFDTVPHQRLLKQVESFGIKHKALAWITAFLDDIVHDVCQRCTRDHEQPDVNVCR